MSDELEMNLDGESIKDDLNLNLNLNDIPEQDEGIHPDHVPLIPYDAQKEREKEEARDRAKKLRKAAGNVEAIIVTKAGVIKKASELTFQEQEDEIIRCAANPIYFIETYLTIFDQTQGIAGMIIPFKLFDFQKILIEAYQGNRFVIANKYRQAGVSTTTCAYIAWYVMFNKNRACAIVANKLETATGELMSDVVEFIESCPVWLKPKTGRNTEENLTDTQKLKIYDNKSKLGAFASKTIRGMTPTLLFWDETAWSEKGDVFWTSALPSLVTGGRAIMVSTPSGLDAVFYKTFQGARDIDENGKPKNNFYAVELWWYNDPRYNKDLYWIKNKGKKDEKKWKDEDWSHEKRAEMVEEGWEATNEWFDEQIKNANGDLRKVAQELLCSFLGSGDNFIAEEYLKRIQEKEIRVPIRQEYHDGNMWIWEDPIEGEDYIMALDASPGHGEDNSTINMLKTIEVIEEKVIKKNGKAKKIKIKRHKVEQVAEYYGKITPQLLAEIAYQYGKAYNDAYCVVDITGGHGVHTIDQMYDIGYENIHYAEVAHKPTRDRLSGYIKKGQKVLPDGAVSVVDLIPGFFIGQNRPSVVLELQRAIHLEDVIIRSQRLLDELKTFVTVPGNRVADHKRSFHDDSIMGLAIGLYVLNFDMAKFKQSKGVTEKMLNSILTINDMKTIADKQKVKRRPMLTADGADPLNPYGANEWLFQGIKDKNKR